jgi:hypothetical protein
MYACMYLCMSVCVVYPEGNYGHFFFQVLELKNANEDEAEDEDDKYTKNH